jgi:hypothetical protein
MSVIPMSEVYELLRLKMEVSEEVAMVWLTTANRIPFDLTTVDMGFLLTDEA